MRSLVVYESWFGNTRRLAEEIAVELRREGEVGIVSVDEALPPLEDVDLLVVGAPTHVHGVSSGRSREAALEQGGDGEVGIGVKGWIDALPNGADGPRVAAFDTRANKPVLLVGSAARGIARRLRAHGYRLAAEPESFFVDGTPGPLEDGELERAAAWGRRLANEVMSPTA
ncbi:MAG: flavodoxin family protein [Gaiellaceae bacterium]